jgi:hypothetical protein
LFGRHRTTTSDRGFSSWPRIDEILDERSRYGNESADRSDGEPHQNGDREHHEADTRNNGDQGDGSRRMKGRPTSARLTTNTSHSTARAKTTLLSTFGTRRARYRPSLRLESRMSSSADRFEACLARIAKNATNEEIASAWSRRACSGAGSCTSQAGCKASTSSRLTGEDCANNVFLSCWTKTERFAAPKEV